jgi:DNA repair photolyase
MAAEYRDEPCQTALNGVRGMPFRWSLNPYMGCAHRCTFCFVRAFERLADRPSDDRYGTSIRVKSNLVEVLRRELARRSWKREQVAVGTATDPYQPAEGRFRLTRGSIVVLGESATPFGVITRGPLIVRDLDVLADAAQRTNVSVTFSVPTLDVEIWRRTEPGTAPPMQRLKALSRLIDRGIEAGVGLAPILPGLSDHPDLLADVVRAARDAGATGVWANLLYLKPGTREHFLEHLARDWPDLLPMYERLYHRGAYAPKVDVAAVKGAVRSLRDEHGVRDRRNVRLEPPDLASIEGDVPIGALVPAPGQLSLQWPGAAVDADRETPVS